MKILLLAPHPFFQARGTPIAERALLEVLSEAGHETRVATFHEGEDPGIPGCTVHRIRRPPGCDRIRPGFSLKKLLCDAYLLRLGSRLCRDASPPDLLHGVEEGAFIAAWLGARHRIPFVYDMDSHLGQQIGEHVLLRPLQPFVELLDRVVMRRATGILTVCQSLRDRALRLAPGRPVALVEDPSLLGQMPATAASPPAPVPGGGPLVLYVGNLEPYQGVELLLHAFAHAADQVPEARLGIVGGAAEHIVEHRRLAARLGVGERVHFTGPRPLGELPALLAEATVLVSPRITGQNTPMKVYSYLDAGKAVLATRLPTHTQVLDDSVALLVEPRPLPFGEGLARLLRDEELRRRLGEKAAELARREFRPEAFRRKLLRFYARVEGTLAPRRPAPQSPPAAHATAPTPSTDTAREAHGSKPAGKPTEHAPVL